MYPFFKHAWAKFCLQLENRQSDGKTDEQAETKILRLRGGGGNEND